MTGETVQYSPDGKGGFVGVTDSAPGAGDTILYSPDGVAAGGGSPGVGDTITYSADGRGGFIGTSSGDSRGLWYWVSNGSNPKDWPTGTDPGWVKILLIKDWNGGNLKFLLDPFSGDYTPHLFWVEGGEIIHYYRQFDGVWVQESVPFPEGYDLGWGHYDVDIGKNNGIIYVVVQIKEVGASFSDPDAPKPLYVFKKISTASPPNPDHWTSARVLDTNQFHVYRTPSVRVAPNTNLGRVVFDEWGSRGLMEIRELSDHSWSSPVTVVPGPHEGYDCIYPKLAISDQGKSSITFVNLRGYFGPTLGELEIYETVEGGTWTRITHDPPSHGSHWINNWSNSGKYTPFFFGSWETVVIPIIHEGEFMWPNTPDYLNVRESYVCTLIPLIDDPYHSVGGWTDTSTYSRAMDYYNANIVSSWWRWGWDYYTYQYLLADDGVLDYAYFDLNEATYYPLKNLVSGVNTMSVGIGGSPQYWTSEYRDGQWIQTHHPAKCHIVFFRG
jgi:hypothetical protein